MKTCLLRSSTLTFLWLLLAVNSPVLGKGHKSEDKNASSTGRSKLEHATVLIIRHAEKPDDGSGLAPAGVTHAQAYVPYFENYQVDGKPIKLTALFAAANSGSSERPYLTIRPLSQAIGLPIDSQFKDKDYGELVKALQDTGHGREILICWHHGEIPNLLRALGADPATLLPGSEWPSDQYGWVVQLRFDKDGKLKESKLVVENL